MSSHGRSNIRMLALFLALPMMSITDQGAMADYVSLSDGRVLHGEVVEESETHIVFRHKIGSIWTNSRLERKKIDVLEVHAGDQADGYVAPSKAGDTAPGKPPAAPSPQAPSGLPQVVVIPLHGSVGGVDGTSVARSFDAAVLQECLLEAEQAKARAVILDIQSPGGLVAEMEAICQTIINHHGRLRIIAYPGDAFSAAAIISMCCKEMVVRPDSRIGAAVIIRQGAGGVSAVDAKMASPHYARQKQFMASSGQPYEVIAAMTIQETQLWWSPDDGFATEAPPSDAGWEAVDGSSTILTMTGNDAVRWGIAAGHATNLLGVLRAVDVPEQVEIVSLDKTIARYNSQLDRRLKDLVKQLTNYFDSLGGLVKSMNELREAYVKQDRQRVSKMKSAIGQELATLQNAGRALERIDRSILARRVELPDAFLAQMKEDAALLGRVSRLLKTDTVDGFNEAVERINTALESWRKLLKMQ